MVKTFIKNSQKILNTEHNNILSAAFVIAAFTMLSAFLGLIRNRLLAANFFSGLESQLDVYFAAFVVPDTIFQLLVTGALSAAFIPLYAQKLKVGTKEANLIANLSLNLVMIFLGVISVLIFVFSLPVSHLIANFGDNQTILLSQLTRIMLLSQLFFGISSFYTSMLQSHKRFLLPAVAPVVYNLSIILGALFSKQFGIYAPAWGVVLGSFLHMLVQYPLIRKLGFRYKFIINPFHPDIVHLVRLMIPRTAALGVAQVERWVSVYFASYFAAGFLTMFNFARQLYVLPISLFGVSLGQASLPTLAHEAIQPDLKDFKKTLKDSLLQIFFFALPASALLLVLRVPVVRIVFGAKAFPWEATLITGRTLALFTLSIAPQAATHILVRAFYALKNTRLPLYVSIITVVMHFVLTLAFVNYTDLNIQGLALAMTIANVFSFILLLGLLERKIGSLNMMLSLLNLILATILTSLSLWLPMRLLDKYIFDTTRTLPLIILTIVTGSIGLLVYLSICKLMGIPQLQAVIDIYTKLNRWRTNLSKSTEMFELEPESLK